MKPLVAVSEIPWMALKAAMAKVEPSIAEENPVALTWLGDLLYFAQHGCLKDAQASFSLLGGGTEIERTLCANIFCNAHNERLSFSLACAASARVVFSQRFGHQGPGIFALATLGNMDGFVVAYAHQLHAFEWTPRQAFEWFLSRFLGDFASILNLHRHQYAVSFHAHDDQEYVLLHLNEAEDRLRTQIKRAGDHLCRHYNASWNQEEEHYRCPVLAHVLQAEQTATQQWNQDHPAKQQPTQRIVNKLGWQQEVLAKIPTYDTMAPRELMEVYGVPDVLNCGECKSAIPLREGIKDNWPVFQFCRTCYNKILTESCRPTTPEQTLVPQEPHEMYSSTIMVGAAIVGACMGFTNILYSLGLAGGKHD